MLIVAVVLAVIGIAALVTAVVTGNELIAWVCIGASALGVLLLVVDAVRERTSGRAVVPGAGVPAAAATGDIAAAATEVVEPVEPTEAVEPVIAPEPADDFAAEEVESSETPDSAEEAQEAQEAQEAEEAEEAEQYGEPLRMEDYPDEVVHDEPDYDTPSEDEPEYPEPAEVAAVHTVGEDYLLIDDTDEPATTTAETVTYTYVENDPAATTYTYLQSADATTIYVESDDTGSALAHDEPWNTRDRSDTSDGN